MRRAATIGVAQIPRENTGGQYVPCTANVGGVGRTIREAREQAKRKGFKNPFLVRLTSEHETLSAGW